MRYPVVFMFCLVVMGNSYAQSVLDSLKSTLQVTRHDTEALKLLNLISVEWQARTEFDSAVSYATRARDMAERLLKKAADGEKLVAKKEWAKALVSLGVVATYNGNYPEALEEQITALKIFEQEHDTDAIASCYLNIGSIYYYQGNYDDALKNFLIALNIYTEAHDDYYSSLAYINIGAVYINRGLYGKALQNLRAALVLSERIGDLGGMANSYNNIGEVNFKQGDYAMALKNHLATLKIREQLGDRRGIITSYTNIGSDYSALGKYNEALTYLDKALEMVSVTGYREIKKDLYNALATTYDKLDDHKKAFMYLSMYANLKDSLANETTTRQMAEMRASYESERKDNEIDLLNKDKELQRIILAKQRSANRYLIAGIALLLVFSVIAFRLYSQKKRNMYEKRVSETELKALRSQMNPHFTFNVLNSIQFFVSENNLEAVEVYLQKFSTLIRMILDQSRTAYITLEQEIKMLTLYLELEEMRFEEKFEYDIKVDPGLVPHRVLVPGMIIQPIVENAIKHGIEHKSGEAKIGISFIHKNTSLLCEVTDNGIGRQAAEKHSTHPDYKSAATAIIKERVEALSTIYDIQLAYKTEDLYTDSGLPAGTCVSIEIPYLADKS